jgi:hypothetical protein
MISKMLVLLVASSGFITGSAMAQTTMSGEWTFQPEQSKNIGMMAGMTIQTRVIQNGKELTVDDHSEFNGQKDTQHTVYNLAGEPVSNKPIMGGAATTRSHWEDGRLVTIWESPGAIAGRTVKRTETRYLSPNGNTMYVESSRPGQDPMVMVFTRGR